MNSKGKSLRLLRPACFPPPPHHKTAKQRTMKKKTGAGGSSLWAAVAVGVLLSDTDPVCAFHGPSLGHHHLSCDYGKSSTRLKAGECCRPLGCPPARTLPIASRTTLFSRETRTIDDETIEGISTNKSAKESLPSSQLAAVGTSGSMSGPPKAAGGYSLILFLCFFVTVLSALDRVAMSVALVPMSAEFGLTDSIKGQISSVFSVGYGLFILPCGLLVAAASPRLIMASGVGIWSLATIGTPIAAGLILVSEGTAVTTAALVENVGPLLAVRVVMGGAESVVLPAVQRILANWVPPDKKSLAVASVLSGFQLGTVCAYLLSPLVIERFDGWRGMFYLYGSVGLLWLIPWLLFAQDLPSVDVVDIEHTSEDEEEIVLMNTLQDDDISLVPEHIISRNVIKETSSNAGGSNIPTKKEMIVEPELPSSSAYEEAMMVFKEAPWKELATSKAVWAMAIAHAANNWGLYINLSWTPTFYSEQYGLSIKDSALLSVLPSIAGAVGGLFAGSSADFIIEKVGGGIDERTVVRKAFQAVALLGPALCLFALANEMPSAPFAAQLLLTGAIGMQAFNCAGYGAATQEKAAKWSGLLYSVTSLPGVVFGSIGVALTGDILDNTGQDWSTVFRLVALVDTIGALAFISLYNSNREFD